MSEQGKIVRGLNMEREEVSNSFEAVIVYMPSDNNKNTRSILQITAARQSLTFSKNAKAATHSVVSKKSPQILMQYRTEAIFHNSL